MKIAIYHNLPSGGAKRTLYESVKRLSERHVLDVFTLSTSNRKFGDMRPFCSTHHVHAYRPLPLFKSPLGRLNQIIRLIDLFRIGSINRTIAERIDAGDYDVAYVQPCRFENSPSLLRHLKKTRSVFFCHEPPRLLYESMPERPYTNKHSPLHQLVNRADPLPYLYQQSLKNNDTHNLRSANSILVNSNFMQTSVNSIYQVPSSVIYWGVDSQFFRPLDVEKASFVLSVGSLTPLKGFDFLIRAISRIPIASRPVLKIVSNFANPPEREYLSNLASELDVELVLTLGVSEEELRLAYNQARLTVYAPIREPFGLVTIESMACGTPVVAVREGGIQETVIDGHVGVLVERDESAFAEAVQRLLRDPKTTAELGRNGRELVEREWTWEYAVERLEGVLESSVLSKTSIVETCQEE